MGLFMPTPEIRLLCIATAVAIFLDYIYTITMYAAIMSIGGRFEMSKEICEKVPRNDNEPTKVSQENVHSLRRPHSLMQY